MDNVLALLGGLIDKTFSMTEIFNMLYSKNHLEEN